MIPWPWLIPAFIAGIAVTLWAAGARSYRALEDGVAERDAERRFRAIIDAQDWSAE